MTRYDIYMDDLRESGDDLKKTATEKIETNINDLKRIANELKWEGPSYDKFMEGFNKKMENISYVSQMIETYGKFMTVASGGYADINDRMYDDYLKEVDKNNKRFAKNKVNTVITQTGVTELVIKDKSGGEF